MNTALSQPLVFIGVPVYNGEKFILDAIKSIRDQTYDNFVCHIINNNSADNTKKIVENFLEQTKDERFFLHNYNAFVDLTSNWNRTVEHLPENAKYYKVVQADDMLLPDGITTMVDLMEKYPTAGIGSAIRMVGTNFEGFGIDYFQGNLHNGREVLLKHLKGQAEITGSITQLFFRTSVLKKVPTYPEIFDPREYHIDSRLAYEMFNLSDLVYAFKPVTFSRRHETSQTNTTVYRFNTLLHGKESRLRRFKEIFPEIEPFHKKVRKKYAYYLLKNRIKNRKDVLAWHGQFLEKKITRREYVDGLISEIRILKFLNGSH